MKQRPEIDLSALLDNMMSCELLDEDIFETLPMLGLSMVINLSSFEEMTVHGEHEAALLSKHGIEHAHLPVFPPLGLTRRNVLQFGVLLATKEQVLVHAPTRDRIGAMVALLAGWFWGLETRTALETGQRFGLKDLATHVERKLERPLRERPLTGSPRLSRSSKGIA